MMWQANPYSLPLLISALASLVVAGLAWQRRAAPGAAALAVLMLGAGVWAAGEAARWGLTSLAAQVAALRVVYLGAALVPTMYFVFVLQVTDRPAWLTPMVRAFLAGMVVLELGLLWTDDWHHWFHASLALQQQDGLLTLQWTRGPAYWLTVIVYPYSLIAIGTLMLVIAALAARGPYRVQLGLILLAALVPFAGSAITQAGIGPFRSLDLAPFAFALAGAIMAYAVFRHRFLDLVPVARGVLIESMPDGVLVLDAQGRVLDINPAAQRLIGPSAAAPIGQTLEQVLAPWPDLLARWAHITEARAEIKVGPDGADVLDLHITPLRDRAGRHTGRLIVFRDITAAKRAQAELQAANTLLTERLRQIEALQNQLREQALRDPLTGLFNRRYLEETLPHEFSRAARAGYPIGVVIIDIDHFKRLNDTHGHAAGDSGLQALAELLRDHTRAGDIVCRYGGEEFLLILPGLGVNQALERAEAWRAAFAASTWTFGADSLCATLSAGVAAFPAAGADFPAVIHAADEALYEAKAAGRNRVAAAPPA